MTEFNLLLAAYAAACLIVYCLGDPLWRCAASFGGRHNPEFRPGSTVVLALLWPVPVLLAFLFVLGGTVFLLASAGIGSLLFLACPRRLPNAAGESDGSVNGRWPDDEDEYPI